MARPETWGLRTGKVVVVKAAGTALVLSYAASKCIRDWSAVVPNLLLASALLDGADQAALSDLWVRLAGADPDWEVVRWTGERTLASLERSQMTMRCRAPRCAPVPQRSPAALPPASPSKSQRALCTLPPVIAAQRWMAERSPAKLGCAGVAAQPVAARFGDEAPLAAMGCCASSSCSCCLRCPVVRRLLLYQRPWVSPGAALAVELSENTAQGALRDASAALAQRLLVWRADAAWMLGENAAELQAFA